MVYDEGLEARIDEILEEVFGLTRKKMFGGLAYMVNGNMGCGIVKDELMVRIGKEAYEDALTKTHVKEMDFTGRAMKGFIYVSAEGIRDNEILEYWVNRGIEYARSLPPK